MYFSSRQNLVLKVSYENTWLFRFTNVERYSLTGNILISNSEGGATAIAHASHVLVQKTSISTNYLKYIVQVVIVYFTYNYIHAFTGSSIIDNEFSQSAISRIRTPIQKRKGSLDESERQNTQTFPLLGSPLETVLSTCSSSCNEHSFTIPPTPWSRSLVRPSASTTPSSAARPPASPAP
jgi:hypothetical protein